MSAGVLLRLLLVAAAGVGCSQLIRGKSPALSLAVSLAAVLSLLGLALPGLRTLWPGWSANCFCRWSRCVPSHRSPIVRPSCAGTRGKRPLPRSWSCAARRLLLCAYCPWRNRRWRCWAPWEHEAAAGGGAGGLAAGGALLRGRGGGAAERRPAGGRVPAAGAGGAGGCRCEGGLFRPVGRREKRLPAKSEKFCQKRVSHGGGLPSAVAAP